MFGFFETPMTYSDHLSMELRKEQKAQKRQSTIPPLPESVASRIDDMMLLEPWFGDALRRITTEISKLAYNEGFDAGTKACEAKEQTP